MDLTTTYLGLQLSSPLMPGASPLVDDLDTVKRLEDAGASAIVMHSLFEEQLVGEQLATIYHMEMHADSFAEALSYFPAPRDYHLGPDEYLEHLRKIKQAVRLPVIASLNGTTPGGWVDWSRKIEQAGADALELNVYFMPTDPSETGPEVEQRLFDIVKMVKAAVRIPVSVKLSPFFSSLSHVACKLEELGADGLVLFNRFYQPDIDPSQLQAQPVLKLSDPSELLLRLRWLAILRAHVRMSLAASGGVHSGVHAIKAMMAGAGAVQVVSALLMSGPKQMGRIRDEMSRWMEEHEYESVRQMQGSMSLLHCPDPAAFERANYMRILQSWRKEHAAAAKAGWM
jgi:dihydroorotate dehydrogenase (fumarate)